MSGFFCELLAKHMRFSDLNSVKADLIPTLLNKQNMRDDTEVSRLFEPSPLQRAAAELQYGIHEPSPNYFRLFGYIATRGCAALIAKCNTLGAYIEANRALLDSAAEFLEPAAKYEGKKVNVVKSAIDKSCKVGAENVAIVKSSVGANCEIAAGTKVEECIVMENVKIANG